MLTSNKYILLILLAFLLESCYTIIIKPVRKNNVVIVNRNAIDFDALKFDVDPELIDSWSNSKLWMDYGYVVKRLQFRYNGKMIYYPNYDSQDSYGEEGEFRTLSDTLIVRFRNSYIIEKFTYKIDHNRLSLSSFGESENGQYTIVQSSTNLYSRVLN